MREFKFKDLNYQECVVGVSGKHATISVLGITIRLGKGMHADLVETLQRFTDTGALVKGDNPTIVYVQVCVGEAECQGETTIYVIFSDDEDCCKDGKITDKCLADEDILDACEEFAELVSDKCRGRAFKELIGMDRFEANEFIKNI